MLLASTFYGCLLGNGILTEVLIVQFVTRPRHIVNVKTTRPFLLFAITLFLVVFIVKLGCGLCDHSVNCVIEVTEKAFVFKTRFCMHCC